MAWTKASVGQKSLFPSFLFPGGSSIWNMLWLLPGPPSTLSEQTGRKMWGVGCPFPAQGLPCRCWLCLLGWVFPREEMRWGLLLSPAPPSLVSRGQAMGPEITRRAEWQHVCRWLPDHPRSQPHWAPWTVCPWSVALAGPLGGFREAPLRPVGCWPPPTGAPAWAPTAQVLPPRVSGHTHGLLVPARLAGVLEAGKLAVPAGPTVLVNDALLRGEEGTQTS